LSLAPAPRAGHTAGMRRRRLLIGLTDLGLLLLIAGAVRLSWVAFAPPPPTLEDANRLEYGMSRADVLATLGRPPDHEQERPAKVGQIVILPDGSRLHAPEGEPVQTLVWEAEGEDIFVRLYEGRVFQIGITSNVPWTLWRRLVHLLRTL
jgi:hypothetical protein